MQIHIKYNRGMRNMTTCMDAVKEAVTELGKLFQQEK